MPVSAIHFIVVYNAIIIGILSKQEQVIRNFNKTFMKKEISFESFSPKIKILQSLIKLRL